MGPLDLFQSPGGSGSGSGNGILNTVLPILGGVSGAFSQPTNTTTTGSGNSTVLSNTMGTSHSDINGTLSSLANLLSNSTTTSGYGAQGNALINQLLPQLSQLFGHTDLSGYQAGQTEQINRNAQLANQNAQNIMASRGLATSPISGTAAAGIDANRVAGITNLQQQIPLLQQQLRQGAIGTAGNVLNLLPKTSTTIGSQQQSGTQNQSQQSNAQQTQDVTQKTNTNSTSTSKENKGGGIGGAIGGVAATLASLFL